MILILSSWLNALALAAWCVPLLLLAPPMWRLARRQGRSLDPLWAVLLLGVVNRIVSDFVPVPADIQHLSAIVIAVLLAVAIGSYQHADR